MGAPPIAVAAGLGTGAIVRAGGRIFIGWGPRQDPLLTQEPQEEPPQRDVALPLMVAVTVAMVAIGFAASVVPGLQSRTEQGAERFRDRAAYTERVLDGEPVPPQPQPRATLAAAAPRSVAWGLASGAIALAAAAFGLWYRRLPGATLGVAQRALAPPVAAVKALHSGVAGDYVMWITVGTAVLGAVWTFTLR